jgi:hypothetical protein
VLISTLAIKYNITGNKIPALTIPRLFKEGSPGRWVIEGPVGVVEI